MLHKKLIEQARKSEANPGGVVRTCGVRLGDLKCTGFSEAALASEEGAGGRAFLGLAKPHHAAISEWASTLW